MCGIAGILNKSSNLNLAVGEDQFVNMLKTLKHRGPEGTSWLSVSENSSYWRREGEEKREFFPRFSFGCSRLAIHDTSDAGLQPISDTTEKVWAALNGEIFNYIELRNELKQNGVLFKTDTDTEVVANAYRYWGTDCFKRFNGQFAIAIWDKAKDVFLLARDRLGIVPLFLYDDGARLAFASEIKAILQLKIIDQKVSSRKISRIIGLPYKLHENASETLFENIKKLPPGEILSIDLSNNDINISKYWNIHDTLASTPECFKEAKANLKEMLVDAVKIRLRSDRKLSFILSGGVDSSGILGIAKKVFAKESEVFSLDLPDERFNENDSIKETLEYHSLTGNFIPVTPELIFNTLPRVLSHSDEPYATPNAILHSILAEAISKSGTKVVLNGVGGDEVFLGYHDHFLFHLYELEQTNNSDFNKELHSWEHNQKREKSLYTKFLSNLNSDEIDYNPDFLARSAGYDYKVLLRSEMQSYIGEGDLYKSRPSNCSGKQIDDISKLTIPYSTKMDDHCYARFAIEARQPFLDHRLVEYGIALSHKFKIKKAIGKFILRQALKEFIPQSRRLDIKKIGLNLPIDRWMKEDTIIKEWVNDNLNSSSEPIYNYIDISQTKSMLNQHMQGERNHSLKIWDLCCTNDWLKRFN